MVAATILASSMAFLDGTIVAVATARIGEQFHTSFGALQWVANGYTLPLAALILLGGSLGDRLGRRRIFVFGTVWFALASLLCAMAPNIGTLIGARSLQGVGAALMTPGSLSILSSAIARDDRAKAVGAWSGLSGVATAAGPLVGGWLVEHASWRWAFGLNLPLAAAVVALALRYVPESSAPQRGRLDLVGVALAAVGLGGLTWALTDAGARGWSTAGLVTVALGVAALLGFLLAERKVVAPLVPLTLFTDRTFSGCNLMTCATYGAMGAVFFVLPLTLQVASGYGPLAAGLTTLPMTVLLLLLSAPSGQLSSMLGPRLQLTVGPMLAAAGALTLRRVGAGDAPYLTDVLPGILLFGLGMATLVAPLTAAVMGAAPESLVGAASGVNNAVARAASLLAVAVIPAVAGLSGDAYRHPATMVQGYHTVVSVCAVVLAAGAVISAVAIPGSLRPWPQRARVGG